MLAIVTTHPIQYQAPIWRELARRKQVEFEVWYLSDQGVRPTKDPGFSRVFQWDIDLLTGYPHRFLQTTPVLPTVSALRGARISSLTKLIRQKDLSAIWINGWQVPAYWQVVFQAYRLGIPVWLRGESNDISRTRPGKGLAKRIMLGMLFSRISQFLYIGSANKRLYLRYGVPHSKLVAAPYCVDNERFAQAAQELAPDRLTLRRAWGIPDAATCFLFCGKFIAKKRPVDILKALKLLLADNPSETARIHLLMVGEGVLRGELEAVANQLQVLCGRPIVSFVGFLNQSEIPRAYVASDCLILPSDAGETWGLVVNEALACGRPAIVSDQCGCAEDLARPLGDDFVFECGDVGQLMQRMRRRLGVALGTENANRCSQLIGQYGVGETVSTAERLLNQKGTG